MSEAKDKPQDALDILLGFYGIMWDDWARRWENGLAELEALDAEREERGDDGH